MHTRSIETKVCKKLFTVKNLFFISFEQFMAQISVLGLEICPDAGAAERPVGILFIEFQK
jgi:hypothetical protein